MKILIAPDSFKESLTAVEVARGIECGFREVFPDADYCLVPMADGGEGTVAALVAATSGKLVTLEVTGPLGEPVQAFYGVTGEGRTAIVEMAAAAGLGLVPPELRNPLRTTTYGVGELIRASLDAGATDLIVGIGGSATNDGGAGMLQALGVNLLDTAGREIGAGGGALAALRRIDVSGLDPRLKSCRIQAACDVDNPLTGPAGASAVFGPQKGATRQMVAELDANLAHFAAIVQKGLGIEIDREPGAGAAGGMGAALLGFLGASLRPGIEIVIEAVRLEEKVRDADLVITGEGRLDSQTIRGKTPIGVARVAKSYGKPVIGIAGCLSADVAVVHDFGIDAVFSVIRHPCSLEEALQSAEANLLTASRNVAASLKAGMRLAQVASRQG